MDEVPIEGNSLDKSDGSVESNDVEALLRNIESINKTSSLMELPASSENFKSLIRLCCSTNASKRWKSFFVSKMSYESMDSESFSAVMLVRNNSFLLKTTLSANLVQKKLYFQTLMADFTNNI